MRTSRFSEDQMVKIPRARNDPAGSAADRATDRRGDRLDPRPDRCSFALSGPDVRVDVHRCMKNSNDQQFIVAERLVEDDVHAVRKLAVALAKVVAGLAHPGIVRQGVEDPIELFQVRVPLAHAPAFLGVSRDRLQIRQRGSGEVECAHFCSASNSDTSDS